MILFYNTIIDTIARDNFDNNIIPLIGKSRKYEIIHVTNDFPITNKYTHLILTGSELSASAGSKWDEKIMNLITLFANANKPILGICHGHQMIARTFGGACRKTAIPEFSWRKIKISQNPIFTGINNPIFLESHYDEVHNLTDEFEIIATNEDCKIQGFQIKNRPIWGIQFHPEMNLQNGNKMINEHLEKNPQDRIYYKNQLSNEKQLKQNFLVFSNFFSL